ncbi:MAG: Crp/Fnr family transcriptional regulator [Erysipelothrix sp.]|nr:Crp/Fnr family transcriptional regulator [Erysipelothrix sp.]
MTYSKSCIDLVPMFNSLSNDEKKEIAIISDHHNFKKGETIYNQGSKGKDLYIVHTGEVKISRLTKDGKEQVIRTLNPGDFMGELSLFLENTHTDFASVLKDAQICILDGDKFKDLLTQIPTISVKLLTEVSMRLSQMENTVESMGVLSVEARLAKKLLELASDNKEFTLPYSKKDMASLLGMSSETLSRKLREFEELEYISLKGQRNVTILDKDALELLV